MAGIDLGTAWADEVWESGVWANDVWAGQEDAVVVELLVAPRNALGPDTVFRHLAPDTTHRHLGSD